MTMMETQFLLLSSVLKTQLMKFILTYLLHFRLC